MVQFFLVAIGSAIGGMARYGSGLIINTYWRDAFPLATFIVNVIGSFIIGALASWLAQNETAQAHQTVKLLLVVGVCGGFTTFSSFSLETLNLLKSGQGAVALIYIGLSLALCLCATAAGYMVFKGN